MDWLLRLGWTGTSDDEHAEREQIKQRLQEQEQRVEAINRAIEVIRRQLQEDRPSASA